jgi:hypothetical protein
VFNGSSPDHFSHAQVVETYNEALEKINPRKAVGPLYPLYVNFAKFYEEGGSKNAETGEPNNAPDLDAARKIFEKATRVPYKTVDELAEVWCEWAEMELRHEYVWKVRCGAPCRPFLTPESCRQELRGSHPADAASDIYAQEHQDQLL